MKKEVILNIDEDILLRFNMALQLNNENCEEVCEAYDREIPEYDRCFSGSGDGTADR